MWFPITELEPVSVDHQCLRRAYELDAVVDRAGLINDSIRTSPKGCQLPRPSYFDSWHVQPHSVTNIQVFCVRMPSLVLLMLSFVCQFQVVSGQGEGTLQ